jgi:uncharacterized protein (DUF1810 family)
MASPHDTPTAADPFDLRRFVEAQAPVFETVLQELREGRKRSHWMWFIFPQIAGLGHSDMARRFAIASRAEAAAYLAHPILGARLVECSRLVQAVQGRSAREIIGPPDDLKFHSSMSLFASVAPERAIFQDNLRKYFAGVPDRATVERL